MSAEEVGLRIMVIAIGLLPVSIILEMFLKEKLGQ